MRVNLVPYDPMWPEAFEAWRTRLLEALGDRTTSIEHFGSTAVPGLDAKPIIDILVARRATESFGEWRHLLASLGLTHARTDSTSQGEGQWFFRDPARTVHIHVYEDEGPGHRRHLAFRDALRRDTELREEYAELKRRLAAREWTSGQEYADAKTEFVRRVEASHNP